MAICLDGFYLTWHARNKIEYFTSLMKKVMGVAYSKSKNVSCAFHIILLSVYLILFMMYDVSMKKLLRVF